MFDLGPAARVAFAAAYLVAQGVLVVTAERRADHAFGFRMFSEASTLEVKLAREVEAQSGHGTVSVPVQEGVWHARDAGGSPHRFDWHDRVREPGLATFDRVIFASYGADAQLARLEAALADVASHTPDDAETRVLSLEVTVRKNGHDPYVVHFSRTRRSPGDARASE